MMQRFIEDLRAPARIAYLASRSNLFVIESAVAIVAMAMLSVRLLSHFDTNWDTLAYHLPFTILRGNLPGSEFLILDPLNQHRYLGFPSLPEYLRAGLWRVFATPNAGALLNVGAIAALSLYVACCYRISVLWSFLVFIAIPTLHTNLESLYVDLWCNAFFSLFLLATFKSHDGNRPSASHTVIALISLGIVANSKLQFAVMGSIGFAVLWAHVFVMQSRIPSIGYAKYRACIYMLFALPIIFFSPLHNTVRYANPVYPIAASFGPIKLNGTETAQVYGQHGPHDIRRLPGWVRYAFSQLEYRGLSNRPGGYTLSQGDVPNGSESDRMGGSLVPIWIVVLGCLGYAFQRNRVLGAKQFFPLAVASVFSAAVLFFPGSYDLRYFSFVEITAAIGAIYTLRALQDHGDEKAQGLLWGLKLTLVGCAIFTTSITGLRHVWPSKLDARGAATMLGVNDELQRALKASNTLCYIRPDPLGILLSKALNQDIGKDYVLVSAYAEGQCPPGAYVIK